MKIEHLQKEQPQNSAVGTVGEIAPKTLIKNRAGGTKKKEKQAKKIGSKETRRTGGEI